MNFVRYHTGARTMSSGVGEKNGLLSTPGLSLVGGVHRRSMTVSDRVYGRLLDRARSSDQAGLGDTRLSPAAATRLVSPLDVHARRTTRSSPLNTPPCASLDSYETGSSRRSPASTRTTPTARSCPPARRRHVRDLCVTSCSVLAECSPRCRSEV